MTFNLRHFGFKSLIRNMNVNEQSPHPDPK
jgi:hypothetical protein